MRKNIEWVTEVMFNIMERDEIGKASTQTNVKKIQMRRTKEK